MGQVSHDGACPNVNCTLHAVPLSRNDADEEHVFENLRLKKKTKLKYRIMTITNNINAFLFDYIVFGFFHR